MSLISFIEGEEKRAELAKAPVDVEAKEVAHEAD